MNQTLYISDSHAGLRLDAYLAQETSNSRNYWQQQLKTGSVRLNQAPCKPSYILQVGDKIDIAVPTSPSKQPLPIPQLKIVYENHDLLVIEKPAGLLVHPTEHKRAPEATVVDFVRPKISGFDSSDSRPGIVHRLDRDTSGLLVVAKNPTSQTYLQAQFKAHKVKKTYLALVTGHPRHDTATINLPLARSHKNALKRSVAIEGKTASTQYRVLSAYSEYSLLECKPESGRTHQLRVHFAHLGHPIAGDIVYGDHSRPPGLKRQFLHATQLQFSSPDGTEHALTSPLPQDLASFLELLDGLVAKD